MKRIFKWVSDFLFGKKDALNENCQKVYDELETVIKKNDTFTDNGEKVQTIPADWDTWLKNPKATPKYIVGVDPYSDNFEHSEMLIGVNTSPTTPVKVAKYVSKSNLVDLGESKNEVIHTSVESKTNNEIKLDETKRVPKKKKIDFVSPEDNKPKKKYKNRKAN